MFNIWLSDTFIPALSFPSISYPFPNIVNCSPPKFPKSSVTISSSEKE